MATNLVQDYGEILGNIAATQPATPTSGDPVRYGVLTGVALTDEADGGNDTGKITMDGGYRIWDLLVDDDEGTGIAVGDAIFFNDTPSGSPATNLNNSTTGYFFGIALEALSANATDTINVLHVPSPGAGTLGAGTVGATELAANSVGTSELIGFLKKGTVQLDITSLREIASNDTQALAAHGGLLASDSDPSLARVNGATDKALRVIWDTAADTDEVQFPPVALPQDLDSATDVTIHLLMAMEAANDTPIVDVQVFNGLGDTEMGGATAAVTGTTITEYTVTIANANIGTIPGFLNIALVPGAHETDALYLYAAWIEYTRAQA
jgi:predicted RecA/RadA family phage recombinase